MSGRMFNTAMYWNARYRAGRTSGEGSEGARAVAKAAFINGIIKDENASTVADWGVGDGTVLSFMPLGVDYLGVDISRFAIDRLRREYQSIPKRRFLTLDEAKGIEVDVDLAISADVIFHCVEDADYREHLRMLFGSSHKVVIIHSSDVDRGRTARHVRWRRFTGDVEGIAPGWKLEARPAGPKEIGWYIYRKEVQS